MEGAGLMKREAGGLGVFFLPAKVEKFSRLLFCAPRPSARTHRTKDLKLECLSALPCFIFFKNLTKIVGSVQLLCNSLEIEAMKAQK